jgi:hypothetical protein
LTIANPGFKNRFFCAAAGKNPQVSAISPGFFYPVFSAFFLILDNHERFFESWKQGEQYTDPKTFAPLISG